MDREQWNERYRSAPVLWTVDPEPFLSGEVGDRPPGRALDLGAGEGRNALWLARRGWHVTAVDFADVALERGRRAAEAAAVAGSVEWVEADLVNYRPPAGAFDLVLAMFVHLGADRRPAALGRAAAALAPGGTVLVVGYDTTNATEGDEGPRDPALLFSPEDVVADLGPGLRVERAERLRVGGAVDAIVRAVRDPV
ncbi:MAG: class I SAM-dependent methyltransferase [Acidimicrobiales bacterium]